VACAGIATALAFLLDIAVSEVLAGGLWASAVGGAAHACGRRHIRRIHHVIERTEDFVAGRPARAAPDADTDELSTLRASVDFMTDHVATIVTRACERARGGAERDLAHAIRSSLLPPSAEIERPGLRNRWPSPADAGVRCGRLDRDAPR